MKYHNTKTGKTVESCLSPDRAAEICEQEGGAFAQHWAAQYRRRNLTTGEGFSQQQLYQMVCCAEQIESSRENA